MKFLIIVTPTENGFLAQVPDVDGCVATGRTPERVERQMRAALEFHVTDLRHRGKVPPLPKSYARHVEIVAATHELVAIQ